MLQKLTRRIFSQTDKTIGTQIFTVFLEFFQMFGKIVPKVLAFRRQKQQLERKKKY
jgi:hypothetical protein